MPDIDDHQSDADESIEKGFFLELQKAKDGGLVAVASSNSIDRHGEVVDNNGWDLKAYKKNPLILWAHDHSIPAIGLSAKTWVEGAGKKAQLMIKPVFHDVTEQAKALKTLVDMGVLKALSVGFKPLESPDGVTFTKNELLEVSLVNVPANPDAQLMAFKTLKEAGFKNKVMKEVGIESPEVLDRLTTMEDDIEELKTLVKAQETVNPIDETKIVRQRLSMNKIIARASDKLLEAEKKHIPVERKDLYKVIKRANELLTVGEKVQLNGEDRRAA